MNRKSPLKALVLGVVLTLIASVSAFPQQTDAKTIDKFNELNQLLPKGKDSLPKVQLRNGRAYLPATKVRINGKDTMVATPLYYTFGKGIAIPSSKINLQGYSTLPYSNPDKIPTVKPDMSKYRMPNMIKPALKNPATIQLRDTVGKK